MTEASGYAGGDGSPAAPYQVCSLDHLTAITTRPEDLGAAFVLVRNIDFDGAAFPGIGSIDTPFTGRFDGGTYAIVNLTITGTDAVGVFNAANGARLANVHLENVTVQGSTKVGSVIGHCERSQLRNATVTAATVGGTESIGGILGMAIECDVVQASLTARVGGSGTSIGGVVGTAERSAFFNIDAMIEVDAPLGFSVGGVVGLDSWSPVILQNVHVSGSVVGNEEVGGLVGNNSDGSQIHRSRFEGTIRGNTGVGGFAGANYDSPFHVYATSVIADVTGSTGVGGFSGRHYYRTNFYDSYFKGTLTGVGTNQDAFGGFFGDVEYYGWVERSYVDVTINSEAPSVGGFIGLNQYWSSDSALYDIARSFAVANVTGKSTFGIDTVSLWVGKNIDPNPLVGAGSYYWSGGTCTNLGAGGCGTGGTGIADRTQFETAGSTPLSAWNFTNVWQAAPGQLPSLRLEQLSQPIASAPCPNVAIAGLRYECDPAVSDADVNEARIALIEPDHSCAWLVPDPIPAPILYSAGLSGTPPLTDAGTCTIGFSVTDGAHTVPTASISLDVHLGVVMTPSTTGRASYNFSFAPINTAGTTVMFTLTNRESDTATISVTGLPGDGFRFVGGTYPGTGGNCGASLPPFGTCTLAINFAPTTTGSRQHNITLQFAAARGSVSYAFELIGYGT